MGGVCHNVSVAAESTQHQPGGVTSVTERPDEAALTGWVTIVWDDPVNLMSYVTHVFTTYFGYPESKASQLKLQVHNDGKAVVSTGGREAITQYLFTNVSAA